MPSSSWVGGRMGVVQQLLGVQRGQVDRPQTLDRGEHHMAVGRQPGVGAVGQFGLGVPEAKVEPFVVAVRDLGVDRTHGRELAQPWLAEFLGGQVWNTHVHRGRGI